MTLGDAKVGTTVVVTKIEWRWRIQTSYHGHGNHERKRALHQKSCSAWRSGRDYCQRL